MTKGWKDDDTFHCWVPAQVVELAKGAKAEAEAAGKPTRWIQGIASTASQDLQGEIVDQEGIDFSYFLKHGYFNNDHKKGFENKVGEPTECKVTKRGLWVKGFLYGTDNEIANSIWNLMHSQEKTANSRRRVGFSIEGKVKRRAGNRIKECWIQDIAITPAPVNTTTWAEIAKSLSAQWDDSQDEDNEEKALSTGTAAGALVPESLDGDAKVTTHKSLTFAEAVSYINENTGVSFADSEVLASMIFSATKE